MNEENKTTVDNKPWSKDWIKKKWRGFKLCLQEHTLAYTMKRVIEHLAEYFAFVRFLIRLCYAVRHSIVVSFLELFIHYLSQVRTGWLAYAKILQFEGIFDKEIYFMDYAGTGDTYLTCSYLHMKELDKGNVFVGSGISKNIARIFDFDRVYGITQKQGYKVHLMRRFLACKEELRIKPLVYGNVTLDYFDIMCSCEGLNGIDFLTMLRIGISSNAGVPFEQDIVFQHPFFCYNEEELADYIRSRGLPKGKTVVLSPYANTGNTFGVLMSEWEELAELLMQKGYTVCTNTSQKNGEQNITGTIPIFLKHDMMPAFCEYAGHFIGVRSGLCDIISGAKLETFITISPPYKVGVAECPMTDYFSLREMGIARQVHEIIYVYEGEMELCDETIEFEYKKSDIQPLVKQIIMLFEQQKGS